MNHVVDPPIPSDAMWGGQTLRVMGDKFDAIEGNRVGDGCVKGFIGTGAWNGSGTPQAASCCKRTARANGCTAPITGNCVELRDRAGVWKSLTVKSVTPRMLEAEMPSGTFACIGETGELARVTIRKNDGSTPSVTAAYCVPSM